MKKDQSRISKLPSLMRKNTIHAMRRRETKRKRQSSLSERSDHTLNYSDHSHEFSITSNNNNNNRNSQQQYHRLSNPINQQLSGSLILQDHHQFSITSASAPSSAAIRSSILPPTLVSTTIATGSGVNKNNNNININDDNSYKSGSINQLARERAYSRPLPPSQPQQNYNHPSITSTLSSSSSTTTTSVIANNFNTNNSNHNNNRNSQLSDIIESSRL